MCRKARFRLGHMEFTEFCYEKLRVIDDASGEYCNLILYLICRVSTTKKSFSSHQSMPLDFPSVNPSYKSVIVYLMVVCYMDNRGISRANTCRRSRLLEGTYLKSPYIVASVQCLHDAGARTDRYTTSQNSMLTCVAS